MKKVNSRRIKFLLDKLPRKPGIYFFLSENKEVIYIGKARSLKERVRSYLLPTTDMKIHHIITETADIDFILTESEKEASFLENNFIQQYQPRYNIRLKDDKSFPYLKLTNQEQYPGIYLTRKVEKDGAKYFGPFSPAQQARTSIQIVNKYFGIRGCREQITGKRKRPCLEYDLNLCSAPCIAYISEADYRERVHNAQLFLEGKVEKLLKIIQSKMEKAARLQEFEQAAHWRDLIITLEQIKAKPRFISSQSEDKDIFGYNRKNQDVCLYIFNMREGKVVRSKRIIYRKTQEKSDKQLLEDQVKNHYSSHPEIPGKILLPFRLEKPEELIKVLTQSKQGKVEIIYPSRGKNKRLLELANRNAAYALERKEQERIPLVRLQEILGLTTLPLVIEGYDISHTGGEESVGSLVVFKQGKPWKSAYRKYKIKTVSGPNDVASLQEVLMRRFSRGMAEKTPFPDLILVDGGKGQFNAAQAALQAMGLQDIPLIAIAKREETIFSDQYPQGLNLDKTSPVLQLIQFVRDEAHRFALTFHRRRRIKKSFASLLDDIPGIGPKRKLALLSHFRSIDEILQTPQADLEKIIGSHAAKALLKYKE